MIRALDRISTEPVNPGVCSFFDAIAALFAGLGSGAGAGAALAGDALAIGAGDALGVGAGALAGSALGAGALAGDALAIGAGDVLGAGGAFAGGAGTAALDTAASALPTSLGTAAGSSAIPASGAAAAPLSVIDPGAATGILDTAASATTADTLNPLNWTGFEVVDPTTGAVTGGGTFPPSATGTSSALGQAAATPGAEIAASSADLGAPAASTSALEGAGGGMTGKALTDASTGTLSSIMGGLKTAAPLVPLASLGMTLAKGEPHLPPQAEQLSKLGSSLGATGQQNLTMAANQQITAPQMAEIDTWKQQQRNALYQLYARSGRDPNNDSDYLQGLQQIEQQAIGMRQQFIDQLVRTGLGETGQATGALQNSANLQIQQDKEFQESLSRAIQAFGLTAGLSGLNVNLSKAA